MDILPTNMNTVVVKAIDLPKMSLRLCSDGIVHCKYNDDVVVFRHDVDFGVDKRIEVFGDEDRPFIININNLKGISNDASRFFASDKGVHKISAVALFHEDEDSEVLATGFIDEYQLPYPIKAFSNYHEACIWLLDITD